MTHCFTFMVMGNFATYILNVVVLSFAFS